MKVLIAYDGSPSADKAIDDLQKAGLPARDTEILVLSVAEVWMPPDANGNGFNPADYPEVVQEWTEKRMKIAGSAVSEAETLSRHARERVLRKHPDWDVRAETAHGSPAWEILARADEFGADLIVVGAQGRNLVGRVLLGSVSQKVLTEARCSVRIARAKVETDPLPLRLMIGFDGSAGATLAIREVASREWPEGTEACLLTAVHPLVPTTIGRFVPPVRNWVKEDIANEKQWIEKLAEEPGRMLEKTGLRVELDIREGNPKEIFVARAAEWQADAIFMGAHSYSSTFEKFLIGSTSAAVAERAGCSVEAVRQRPGR